MLGPEKEILANEVAAGQVKIVYWPMLDLGPNSHDSAAAVQCAGEQDPLAFWRYHDTLYENQRSLYLARREFYVDTAVALGLDQAAFERCFDGGASHDLASQLDETRRAAGIFNRPTFTVGRQQLIGSQPYEAFAAAIAAELQE